MSASCNQLYKEKVTEATAYNQLLSNETTCASPPFCSEYDFNLTQVSVISGNLAYYGTHGFINDFNFN